MNTYEFKLETLSEDMGIVTRRFEDCTEEVARVCSPVAGKEYIFIVGKKEVKISYDADSQPTITFDNNHVLVPDELIEYKYGIITWVIEALGSSAAMMLTGASLIECAKEFAYEFREGFDSCLLSAKVLIQNYFNTGLLHEFFRIVRGEFKEMAWFFKPLMWELDEVLFKTLVDAGISAKTVAEALTKVFTFDELYELMQEFNQNDNYECQLFVTEVMRAIPDEEMNKRWEL